MLHPIKLPDYDQKMDTIARFLESFIEFICDPATPITPQKEDFQRTFGDALGARFFRWLGRIRYNYLCQIEFALQANPALRQAILSAFYNDITFFEHLKCDDATFRFGFNNALSNDIRDLFSSLWKDFYTGLFAAKGGFFIEVVDFDRKRFLTIFRSANKELEVCPACDGYIEQDGDVEVDHIFPKSLYPFLALHVANLAPLCHKCNDIKHNKDPLDHSLPDPLLHTFHPYGKPAFREDENKNKMIKIIIYREEPSGERKLRIEEQSGGISKRVQKLDDLFELKKRWNERIKKLIGMIEYKIRKSADDRFKAGWKEEDLVDSVLESEIRDGRVGKDAYYVVDHEYADYALHDPDERASFFAFLKRDD